MLVTLTKAEVGVLLNAGLTYLFRPFHSVTKRRLSTDDVSLVSGLEQKLIQARDRETMPDAESQAAPFRLELSEDECRLLVFMLTECLKEFGDDSVDLRLHLSAHERKEVDQVILKLSSLTA